MLDYEFLQLLIILFINCFTDRVVADSYSQTWRNTLYKSSLDSSYSECILVRSYYSKVVIVIEFK